jgi:hypothetical protein
MTNVLFINCLGRVISARLRSQSFYKVDGNATRRGAIILRLKKHQTVNLIYCEKEKTHDLGLGPLIGRIKHL